jgi:ribosomal protein S18 acetylase RimI-like enzyme
VTRVRPAVASDLEAIVRTFLACWHESYVEFLPPEVRDMYTLDSATALWRRSPLDSTLVAELDDRGVLGVTRFGDGHIFSLYVHPGAQGAGLGKALLEAATDRMREHAELTLWVFAGNTAARAFYASQGWLPDGATRVEDAYGLPELRLAKTLRQ